MSIAPHLQCMGRPVLIASDGNPVRFRTRKHLGLLLYLALMPRRPYRREHLVELLWPAARESGGRHSLATALSVLRARLGRDCVTSVGSMVHFTPPDITLDLDRLAANEVLGDEYTPPLEVAALLADFDIPDAPEFMIWRDRQRSRWLPQIREALIRLIDLRRRTGAFREIETLADSLMGLDELSEDAIRAKMEARAFDGDRLTALRLYEDWSSRLQAELQASPGAMVEGIATRLRRRGWERPTSAPVPPVPTDQWKNRPFVGRAAEYRQIYETWERAREGSPRHVLLLGDSGVGKSTLLDRVATAAGLEGAAVSRVQCYELERDIPYAALSSLVRGLLDRPGAAATSPEWLAELARTVPEVKRRFPGIPASLETQGETARVRLTEAVQQLIIALSEEQPVILVVDDLHQTDDASLAVLHLLLRRSTSLPLIALMAARPGGLGQSPQAVRFREGTARIPLLTMNLPPLSVAEAAQLLDNLLQDEPRPCSPAVRKALLAAAHGYPMVLQHLVLDWTAHGDRALALAVGAMTEDLRTDEPEVETYRALIQRISAQLDATAQHVLMLAAVLGPRLNELGLYRLVDLTATQTLAALAELARTRVLRDGGRELEFANELFRGEAYRAIPTSLRRSLHSDIADDLLRRLDQGEAIPGLEIAWHCIRSGRTAESTGHLLRGAEEAMNRGAAHAAEIALSAVTDHLRGSDRSRAELLMADALQEQGRWKESLDYLEGANLPEMSTDFNDDIYIRMIKAKTKLRAPHDPHDDVDLERLTTLATAGGPLSLQLAALLLVARISEHSGSSYQDPRLIKASLDIDAHGLSEEHLGDLAVARGLLFQRKDLGEEAIALLTYALTTLRKAGMLNSKMNTLLNALGCVHCSGGGYDRALPYFINGFDLAVTRGDYQLAATICANLSLSYMRLMRHDEQIAWYERGVAFPEMAGAFRVWWPAAAAIGYHMLGKYNEAQNAIHTAHKGHAHGYLPAHRQILHLQLADALFVMGNYEESNSEASMGIALGPCSIATSGRYARWLARMSVAEENVEPAEVINDMVSKVGSYDVLDQVEILYAASTLNRSKESASSTIHALGEKVALLPPSTVRHLVVLGLDPRIIGATEVNQSLEGIA